MVTCMRALSTTEHKCFMILSAINAVKYEYFVDLTLIFLVNTHHVRKVLIKTMPGKNFFERFPKLIKNYPWFLCQYIEVSVYTKLIWKFSQLKEKIKKLKTRLDNLNYVLNQLINLFFILYLIHAFCRYDTNIFLTIKWKNMPQIFSLTKILQFWQINCFCKPKKVSYVFSK